jgi:hypothetical protein
MPDLYTDLDQAIDEWRTCDQGDVEKAIGSLRRLRVAVTQRIAAYERLIAERRRDDADGETDPASRL